MANQELTFKISIEAAQAKAALADMRGEIAKTAQSTQNANKSELSMRQQLSSASSLQRQRSAALIAEWKRAETQAANLAKGVRPVGENLQKVTDIMQALGSSSAVLQGPMGGVASRLRSIGAIATEAGGGLGIAGAAIGALLAASVGAAVGIYKLVSAFAEATGHLHDLSQRTNYSVETLSALQHAAETSGGSIESISAALGIFQRNMEEAATGNKELAQVFKVLNIDINDNEKALRQAFQILSQMPAGAQQTALSMKLFGRSGREVMAVFKEAGGDLDAFISKLRDEGLLVTGQAARKGDELSDSITKIGQQFSATGRAVANEFAPLVADALSTFSRWLRDNQGELVATARAVAGLIKDIGALASFIYSISPIRLSVQIIRTVTDVMGAPAAKDSWTNPTDNKTSYFGQLWDMIQRGPDPNPRDLKNKLGYAPPGGWPVQTKEQIAATTKANADAQKKTADDARKLQDQLNSLRAPRGGAAGRKREEESEAHKAIMRSIEEEKTAIADLDRVYREAADAVKRSYQNRLSSFSEYMAAERAVADKRKNDAVNLITEEQKRIDSALAQRVISQKEYDRANDALARQKKDADDDRRKEETRLEDEERRRRLELEANYLREREALRDQKDADQIAALGRMRSLHVQDAEWFIANERERVRAVLRAELGYNEKVKLIELQRLKRKQDALYDEVRAIAEHYAEVKNVSIEEAMASKVVQDALRERAIAIEAIEYQRSRVIKETSDANIDAYRKEAKAAFDAQNAGAAGATRPRSVTKNIDEFGKEVKPEAFEKFTEEARKALSGESLELALFGIDAMRSSFEMLGNAVGEAVRSFVLFGKVEGGFRKFAAEMIASIAQMAAVQAVYQAAQGLAWLALNFFLPNPAYYKAAMTAFASAAVFGGIAGVAAIAGRALAGNAFSSGGGGSSGTGDTRSGSQTGTDQRTNQPPALADVNRRAIAQPKTIIVQPIVQLQLHGDIATDSLETRVVNAVVKRLDLNDERLTGMIQGAAQRGR